MQRNDLSLDTETEAFGISRRMLAYYRSGQKPIPKHIWLACAEWETQKDKRHNCLEKEIGGNRI